MGNAFDAVRLPVDIERGATGGPVFRTTIITLISGREQRNQEWDVPLHQYNIGYGIQKREQLETVYAFFKARGGRARGFLFRDWLDYTVNAAPVGIVADPLQRQLVRVYADAANEVLRIVTKPDALTLKVYVDNVLTTDYTLEDDGILQFSSDPGNNVKASFEFDIPMRFDTDDLQIQLNTYREGVVPSIQITEIR